MKSLLKAALFAVLASPSVALAGECALDYATFEGAVPHNDLETCPASIYISDAYCRVSVNAEVATIFVFSETDDCIIATRAYHDEEYSLTFN